MRPFFDDMVKDWLVLAARFCCSFFWVCVWGFPSQVSKWRMMARGLIETLEARGTWAAKRRTELGLGPANVEGLEPLRPEVGTRCIVEIL